MGSTRWVPRYNRVRAQNWSQVHPVCSADGAMRGVVISISMKALRGGKGGDELQIMRVLSFGSHDESCDTRLTRVQDAQLSDSWCLQALSLGVQ